MKILHANNNYYIKGGSDTVFFNTTKLLESKGYEVIPFASDDVRNFETEYSSYFPTSAQTDTPRITDSLNFLYNYEAKKKIAKLLSRNDIFDLAHLHIYYGKLTTSILSELKKKNIPIVQTLHEYKLACPIYTLEREGKPCDLCVEGTTLNSILYKCKNKSYTHSLAMLAEFWSSRLKGDIKLIDQFICVSDFQRRMMERVGVPSSKLNLLYNFIDLEDFKHQSTSEKEDYFLYFGRIEKLKGISTLIQASKITGQKLLIVGTGKWEAELEKEIFEIPNIAYLGFKYGDELKNLIAKARAVVVPSEWYENCPMSILESKALGTAVIGANIGGIPELINNGKDGLLFEPGNVRQLVDALLKLDNVDIKDFSLNARQDVVRRFSKEVHLTELLSIYRKAIQSI